MLIVDTVEVAFGATRAVQQASFELPDGQVLAVLGPSGCGKSTLLRAVAGLEPLASGRILLDDQDLAGTPPHRRNFALMFQDGQLFPHLSVAKNVAYPLRLRRTSAAQRRQRVGELLDLVGLTGYENRSPGTLSGGEQQRVALARALAAQPRLLLLDEPLSALDRSLRERLAVDLRTILTATQTTALLVTHDHDEAFTIADRMAVMFAGQIVQQGSTTEVWAQPATAQVARFLGYTTVLEGEPARIVAARAGLTGADSVDRLALRRSALRVDERGELRARVLTVAAVTDAIRVGLEIDGVGRVEGLADRSARIDPGDRVGVRVDPADLAREFRAT